VLSLAAEFPNDNPALHRGASWVCLTPTSPPTAVLPEPTPNLALAAPPPLVLAAVEEDREEDEPIVVEELDPLEDASIEGDEPALAPVPDDPFTALLCALAEVAVRVGSPDAAAILPALLMDGRLEHPLPEGAAEALAEAGIIEGGVVAEPFVRTTRAWRAILRGSSEGFDVCGTAMLDEWAADLLARLLGSPARAHLLRRELRARGVAAFGVVEAA
jgi:hypothetical protein